MMGQDIVTFLIPDYEAAILNYPSIILEIVLVLF